MTTHTNRAPLNLPPATARALTTAGTAVALAGTFLAWTWTDEFPGDLTVTGYPGGLQVLTLVGSLVTLLLTLSGYGLRGFRWLTPGGTNTSVRYAALAVLATTGYTVGAITVDLGGVVNLEPGAWVSLAGALIATLAAFGLPADQALAGDNPSGLAVLRNSLTAPAPARARELPSWAEILIIAGSFGVALYLFSFIIDTEYTELFIGSLLTFAFGFTALHRAGLIGRLTALTVKHRNVTLTAALLAAFCFPFTQSTGEFTLIGTNILIFAAVALGLNVVVGLAGLLDLGYVAFLGVGAYTSALVSGASASAIGIHFPFWAAALTGAGVSLIFGVFIGAPTLRLRGDYLAIVTLGFGEIFRVTVNNLNGNSGPDLTNGSQGIPSIPDLDLFGFAFGESHDIGPFSLSRSANYFLLMLLVTAVVILVFRRSGDSRIGRAWVAIREDETAATAMGINAFRLKLLAFALGATLAGLAGTVQAHVNYTVTPEQYQFAGAVPPNSAFLLAAVILGGMGTLSGPFVGAALLYLIPAKLQFMQDYQLLLFGIALILLMRFRPEGLIADRRKQLEFHESDADEASTLNDQPDVPEPRQSEDTGAGIAKAGA